MIVELRCREFLSGNTAMDFYFCEKCGKRLTEADIGQGLGKNKKLTGVYCSNCAPGALTIETLPIDLKQAREILRAAAGGVQSDKARPRRLEPQTPSAKRDSETGARAHAERRSASPSARTKLLVVVSAGVVLAAFAVLWFVRGDGPQTPESPADSASQAAAPAPVPKRSQTPVAKIPPVVQASPAQPVTPAKPAPPQDSHPAQNTDAAAEAEFDVLSRDTKLEDRERIAKLEQFLQKYGDSTVAARARVMLAQLKRPEPKPVVEPPPKSVVVPPPKPKDETAEARAA